MKGRKPKPTALKLLAGDRPDRVNLAEPRPAGGPPAPPEGLDAEAAAEWARMVPMLERMGVLTEADGPALAIYCRAHSRAVRAQKQLDEDGAYVRSGEERDEKGNVTKSGVIKGNPAAGVLRTAETTMLKVLGLFGCDPSNRSRVKAQVKPEPDAFDAFLADSKRPRSQGKR